MEISDLFDEQGMFKFDSGIVSSAFIDKEGNATTVDMRREQTGNEYISPQMNFFLGLKEHAKRGDAVAVSYCHGRNALIDLIFIGDPNFTTTPVRDKDLEVNVDLMKDPNKDPEKRRPLDSRVLIINRSIRYTYDAHLRNPEKAYDPSRHISIQDPNVENKGGRNFRHCFGGNHGAKLRRFTRGGRLIRDPLAYERASGFSSRGRTEPYSVCMHRESIDAYLSMAGISLGDLTPTLKEKKEYYDALNKR